MKTYNSMYLGLCINNDDPEQRGRVQIFIPHIMPSLYEGWNQDAQDIKITCVGDNMIDGLTSERLDKLKQILPWAEAASPILGTSSPGNLMSQVGAALGGAAGAAIGGVGGAVLGAAAGGAIGSYFDQSPNSRPIDQSSSAQVQPGNLQSLFNVAKGYNGGQINFTSSQGYCGIGSRSILGAMTGNSWFRNGLGTTGAGTAASLSLGGGNNYLTRSGMFNGATTLPPNYMKDTSQWQVGDTVVCAGGRKGYGHIQVWTGSGWVSDFPQKGILTSPSYNNFTLYRANEAGLAAMQQTLGGFGISASSLERTSSSGDSPSAPSQVESTPKNLTSAVPPSQYGNIANQNSTGTSAGIASQTASSGYGQGTLSAPGVGQVPANASSAFKAQYERVYNALNGSKFIGTVPKDGATYGITTGSQAEWANFYTRLASVESGFNPGTSANLAGGQSGNRVSFGVYQLGQSAWNTYGSGNIYNATDNTNAAIKYAENLYFGSRYGGQNVIGARGDTPEGYYGLAAAWGPLRKITNGNPDSNQKQLLAENITDAQLAEGAAAAAAVDNQLASAGMNTNIVNNTDRHPLSPTQNLNGVAKGVFSFPAAGAMLWVFFREGNPLFPVYFAASYSQAEWQSAYRYSSPGPGYNPVPKNGEPQSTGGMMNLNGVGGIRWEDTNNSADRTQDQKSIMFFGEDGSNIFMGSGYNQYYSKYDRRDQVEGDRFETTLGFKEEWVQGDSNLVVMGDQYIKIGNVGPEAQNAVQRIQDLIKQIQAPLSEGSG